METSGRGFVRTGFSYADAIQRYPLSDAYTAVVTPLSEPITQSERGLDSAEWSPEGDPEARASGKSERSERNDGGRSRSRRVVA
jgi:hypothetical protein